MPSRSVTPWGRRFSSPEVTNPFEEFMSEFDRGLSPFSFRSGLEGFAPLLDLEEKDNMYMVTVDLPGLKKEDIKVNLSDNILTISGERVQESKSDGRYRERVHGKFSRSLSLPGQLDSAKVSAKFENGVLHLTIPKSEVSHSHSIKIQ